MVGLQTLRDGTGLFHSFESLDCQIKKDDLMAAKLNDFIYEQTSFPENPKREKQDFIDDPQFPLATTSTGKR